MIILGIDPGYAIVGFGIIEKGKYKTEVIDYGVITTPKEDPLPIRLKSIYDGMCALIDKYKPEHVAIEELFFNTNTTTGIAVAEARGVILLACLNKGLKLYEYTPLQIKQALTSNGRADKQQVQFMVKAILNLKSIPKPDDAADGLAVAVCHSQTNLMLSGTDIR
ncbi:MAG: crossover junction endodeoxyribonuclease RuvC [Clostridiales bacterium]|nr:crossover junction endodeoxyribonuclease RuvC [Clostridiales bacterium]